MHLAFALPSVAFDEKAKGNRLAIVRERPDQAGMDVVARVVGF